MNAFEIFGLMTVGALLIHGLLAALLRLEARLMRRGRDKDSKSIAATAAPTQGGADRCDDRDATLPPKEETGGDHP